MGKPGRDRPHRGTGHDSLDLSLVRNHASPSAVADLPFGQSRTEGGEKMRQATDERPSRASTQPTVLAVLAAQKASQKSRASPLYKRFVPQDCNMR